MGTSISVRMTGRAGELWLRRPARRVSPGHRSYPLSREVVWSRTEAGILAFAKPVVGWFKKLQACDYSCGTAPEFHRYSPIVALASGHRATSVVHLLFACQGLTQYNTGRGKCQA